MMRYVSAAVLFLFALPSSALAWGTHYLVTDRALEHPDVQGVDVPVQVETLEAFLDARADDLAELFDDYYDWLEARGSTRFNRMSFDAERPTVATFLRASRLNPESRFVYVERVLPHEPSPDEPVELAVISPYLSASEPLRFDFRLQVENSTPRAILSTYSDEPDWIFDHALWQFEAYGYGEQPYGAPEGESSKAPFHMLFAHENWLVRTFAPHITEGMAVDRTELFVRLSRLAFDEGHDYWGWRFAAWALHYVQDLTQPYHSRALPHAGLGYYLRYIFSLNKARMQDRATQLAANRHFLYEDFVSHALDAADKGEHPHGEALGRALASGVRAHHVRDVSELIEVAGGQAAQNAAELDQAVVEAFGEQRTSDPTYDLTEDEDYRIDRIEIPEGVVDRLMYSTARDFQNAGMSTRALLDLVDAPMSPETAPAGASSSDEASSAPAQQEQAEGQQ